MPRFFYKAKKGPGDVTEGAIDADSEAQALSKITAIGLYPVSIKAEGEISENDSEASPFFYFKRIKVSDLAVFTRQFADLLDAGITIVNALDVLSQQTENKKLRKIVGDLRDHIKSGNTFTAALERYPSVFSGLYISMVHSGEASGTLENVLGRLSDFLEEQEEFKSKVQAALAYPILMASVGLITVIVLLTFVMPRVVGIFQDLGQELPLLTLVLLKISGFIRAFWYIIIVAAAFLFFMIKKAGVTPEGKAFFDAVKNKTPLLGALLKKSDIARFARTLGVLLNSGVSILHALDIVSNIMSSELAKRDIKEAFDRVKEGSQLAKALSAGGYFPLFVINMIAVGEESGQLEKAFLKIADSYERETDKTIKIISSLIEPIMILVMGLMVGFIVVSILLPIFQISLIAK